MKERLVNFLSHRSLIIVLCGLVAIAGPSSQTLAQTTKPRLPKSHRHIGVDRFAAGEKISEFTMSEASLEARSKKENLVTNRTRTHDAFTVSGTKLFVAERRTGKIFEIRGLPLEWRPFSDVIWADDRTLMFDRWSQPHYGVHYAVNVLTRQLITAVPFPDKIEKSNVVQELNEIEQQIVKALLAQDLQTYSGFLAPDWTTIDLTGRVLTRSQVLEELASNERKIESASIDDVRVRNLGTVAVVTGRTSVTGSYQGKSVTLVLRFTDVFEKRNGRWQVVASQGTQVIN